MPSRKPHSKSRRGCEPCKQRRVKCDEQGWPDGPCAACVIRKIGCVYRSALLPTKRAGNEAIILRHPHQSKPTPSSLQLGPSEAENDQDASPSNQGVSVSSRSEMDSVPNSMAASTSTATAPSITWADRTHELRLMHFWSTKTIHTFDIKESKLYDLWRETLFDLMFKHDFLLDLVFALTSVHMATEEDDLKVRSTHVSKALEYQNKAFTPFSDNLENLSPENCNVILASTVLNMACSAVAGQLPTGDKDRAGTPLQSILTLYDSIGAIHQILQDHSSWLLGGPFEGILPFMQGSMPLKATDFRREWTQDDLDDIQKSMRRLRILTGQTAVEKHPIYAKAVAMLDDHFTTSFEHGIGWLTLCGPAFIEDITKEEPVALMVLLHWGVLLKHVETVWWIQYSGSRLVEYLSSALQSHGSDQMWNDAIVWCQTRDIGAPPKK